jgi:FlaA1/EpsC-like NDP-sugar epimerase
MAIRPLDTVVIHEMPLFSEHIEPSHTRNQHITMLNSKNILITGGTGSFGKAFTRLTLEKYNQKNHHYVSG